MIRTKENFTALYTVPISIDPSNNIYQQMAKINPNIPNLEQDLRYFNNASNIIFGAERIPIS
jgi:trehalose-6-phosphate synthase